MQILILDLVFSIDSIITAVGMTDDVPIMVIAVIAAVTVMLLAAGPLSRFIQANPTVAMLALGFLLMIGMTLIADGFGVHVPKGYIYAAMAFSALVEALNMLSRRAQRKQQNDLSSVHASESCTASLITRVAPEFESHPREALFRQCRNRRC
jgi:predicted tellurium resistance membrane protein TerC